MSIHFGALARAMEHAGITMGALRDAFAKVKQPEAVSDRELHSEVKVRERKPGRYDRDPKGYNRKGKK